MTKLTKSALLSVLFVTCFTTLFAQDNPFVGKWELDGIPPEAEISFYKVFNAKGEFYNSRTVQKIAVKTHNGNYQIKDKSVYLEIISPNTAPGMEHLARQTTTIQYKFSEDKKTLTLIGLAVNGHSAWNEVWKKVIEKPYLVILENTKENLLKALDERVSKKGTNGTFYAIKFKQK